MYNLIGTLFRLLFLELYLLELNGGNQQYNFKNLVELLSLSFNNTNTFIINGLKLN